MIRRKWTVLIADDEPLARRGVRQLLAPFPEFVIVRECRDGASALKSLDAVHPDVVFLDVQMPGLDGFDVLAGQRVTRLPLIVFLTAYDRFAVRAFEAQAFDYLVKPVSEVRFGQTIQRLTRRLQERERGDKHQFIIPTTGGSLVLPLADIDWIEATGNYARLWTGSKSFLVREPLRSLQRRLHGRGFVRAHRRALVPVDRVHKVEKTRDGDMTIVLRSGTIIPVSRRRRGAVRACLRTGDD